MSICHEIPVLAFLCFSLLHPCPLRIIEQEIGGLVDKCPAVACQDAVFELALLAELEFRIDAFGVIFSLHPVQCAERSFQVALLLSSRMPCECRGDIACGSDRKVVGCESAAAFPVFKNHLCSLDADYSFRLLYLIDGFRIFPFRCYE